MLYRDNKQFYVGGVHHVYNRGVNKELIFYEPADYFAFLLRLGLLVGLPKPHYCKLQLTSFEQDDFDILGYCLMPNHFHLQMRQNKDIPTSELIHKLCTSYAMYFNRKYERVGPLWQDSFKAKDVTGDEYLLVLSAYIHNNPQNPETYPYSSYLDYLGQRQSKLCNPKFILSMFGNNRTTYQHYVEQRRTQDTQPFWE